MSVRKHLGMPVCASSARSTFYQCAWTIPKWLDKKNPEPMWKRLMQRVDLEKPTAFLDQVYLACTQRECTPTTNLVDECRKMFESLISVGAIAKLLGSTEVHVNTARGPTAWKNMPTSASKGTANLRTGMSSSTNAWPVGFLTFITRAIAGGNVVMREILPNSADSDFFRIPILLVILKIQNRPREAHLLFQSVGCAKSKLQSHTVPQSQREFPGRWFAHGWCSRFGLVGFS